MTQRWQMKFQLKKETGEAESGQVDDNDGKDHDKFDLGDMW